ncbi:hypothetical protein TcasGA2_TC007730 [Tribolium castaneum]|uniref:Uncharacterized protein n=1 Tax=Tribolium castaneum TaxID=7070 RepID=D2A1S9_TRICA|nr:PREDICTED: uncharacterized protein LOC107397823 [Tribolium castaneum]EFA02093.2 hypothetical protein TcasGA2_TC007730 [Tribolium castaneum]|eukprot:XP_015834914.1 PREDICTED: uncharacterized protein LOC107397823 [Tribolium castaneum]
MMKIAIFLALALLVTCHGDETNTRVERATKPLLCQFIDYLDHFYYSLNEKIVYLLEVDALGTVIHIENWVRDFIETAVRFIFAIRESVIVVITRFVVAVVNLAFLFIKIIRSILDYLPESLFC